VTISQGYRTEAKARHVVEVPGQSKQRDAALRAKRGQAEATLDQFGTEQLKAVEVK